MNDVISNEEHKTLNSLRSFGRFYLDVWDLIEKAVTLRGEIAILVIRVEECLAIKDQVYPFLVENLPDCLVNNVLIGASNDQNELLVAICFSQRGESSLAAYRINAVLNDLGIDSLQVKYASSYSLHNLFPDILISDARKSFPI